MKKVILFALMCVCALSAHAIENAKCYLQHGENVTTYDASAIATAIEDAVKGDVLYLGEGQYPAFTLDKEITVRGAGCDKTKISSYITIGINGSPTLTKEVLVGLGVSGNIELSKAMTHVVIKKCSFTGFYVNADNEDIIIDQCQISGSMNMRTYIKGMTVVNSAISQIYTGSGYSYNYINSENVCIYQNCNIDNLYNYGVGWIQGTFINCIVRSVSYNNNFGNCIFTNTLSGFDIGIANTSSKQECYVDTKFSFDDSYNCSYDAETLTTKGYLGNDGTVVGIEGGTNPFSLDLNLPRITASKLQLDRENKVLNVNLKVTSK